MERLEFKLPVFEGPLDLLLHLLDRNKVDIWDIPISEITDQYMEYMNAMKEQNLDISSEFLMMAATLLDIKSKMLLPGPEEDEDGNPLDPREELVRQLMEYKLYKYISGELKDLQLGADQVVYRAPSIPKEVQKYEPPVDPEAIVGDRTLAGLHQIFLDVMKRSEERLDPIRSKFGTIRKAGESLDDKIRSLRDYAGRHSSFSFRHLLESAKTKDDVIVTFLAVLEMMKTGDIQVVQEETFGDMQISSKLAA